MGVLYEKLRNGTSREDVRAAFFGEFGLSFPARQKFDSTEQVLYVFRKEKRFAPPQGIASPLAQALYILRELKYGEAGCPVPPYICAVCRGEAFFVKTKSFSKFYARRKTEKYDWDRTPCSPCPKLVSELIESPAFARIRVYALKDANEEAAFRAALKRVRAIQLSLFEREKKTIDENNFLSVYEYWSSLFTESLGESGEVRKLAEYFLSDVETGKSLNKNGRVEFSFGGEKVTKSLPVYEYNYFWSLYERVKDEKTIFAIRRKIDRLSEDFARRFEGEFYTPIAFAGKAFEYLLKTIGKKKLESGAYRIWDMAAGSGNLEFTLPGAALPYTYVSTLSEDDANYCRRIFPSAQVFQYDYLNDDVEKALREPAQCRMELGEEPPDEETKTFARKMPEKLWKDLRNPKLKWLIFINPPFATSNLSSLSAGKISKSGVSDTRVRQKMLEEGYGETGRELFSQFLFRISREFKGKKGYLGLFSTLKYLNAPNDRRLRDGFFRYRAERGFLFSSECFEGSKGKFPVSFAVWNLEKQQSLETQTLVFDVFNREAEKVGTKRVYTADRGKLLSAWAPRPPTKYVFPPFTGAKKIGANNVDVRDRVAEGFLCSLMCCGNDFQHQNQTALFSGPQASAGSYSVTAENFEKSMAVHAVRKLPKASWSNNRDQFYAPDREPDEEFFTDCAVWSAFADSDNTVSLKEVVYQGKSYRVRNQLFPFSREQVKTWREEGGDMRAETAEENFFDGFSGVFGDGLVESGVADEESFFFQWLKKRTLSGESERVMQAAADFYAYCFRTGKAEIWDAGYAQLKAAVLKDETGRALLTALKAAHRELGKSLLPRVYEYGFVAADVEYFEEGE